MIDGMDGLKGRLLQMAMQRPNMGKYGLWGGLQQLGDNQDRGKKGKEWESKKKVTAPINWQSSPGHPMTHLAYITDRERELLAGLDLHGSGVSMQNPHYGPKGIPSLNGSGDGAGPGGDNAGGNAGTGGGNAGSDGGDSAGAGGGGYGASPGDNPGARGDPGGGGLGAGIGGEGGGGGGAGDAGVSGAGNAGTGGTGGGPAGDPSGDGTAGNSAGPGTSGPGESNDGYGGLGNLGDNPGARGQSPGQSSRGQDVSDAAQSAQNTAIGMTSPDAIAGMNEVSGLRAAVAADPTNNPTGNEEGSLGNVGRIGQIAASQVGTIPGVDTVSNAVGNAMAMGHIAAANEIGTAPGSVSAASALGRSNDVIGHTSADAQAAIGRMADQATPGYTVGQPNNADVAAQAAIGRMNQQARANIANAVISATPDVTETDDAINNALGIVAPDPTAPSVMGMTSPDAIAGMRAAAARSANPSATRSMAPSANPSGLIGQTSPDSVAAQANIAARSALGKTPGSTVQGIAQKAAQSAPSPTATPNVSAPSLSTMPGFEQRTQSIPDVPDNFAPNATPPGMVDATDIARGYMQGQTPGMSDLAGLLGFGSPAPTGQQGGIDQYLAYDRVARNRAAPVNIGVSSGPSSGPQPTGWKTPPPSNLSPVHSSIWEYLYG